MTQARRFCASVVAVSTAFYCLGMAAQAGDPAQIQAKLASQIKLTKSTADRTDIVTAGDVVVLQKDGLMMCSSDSSYAFANTYSNGVLAASQKNRAKDAAKLATKNAVLGHFGLGGGSVTDAASNSCNSRKFVAGEKFWVTAIAAQKDGILVTTLSDPFQDVRYYGEIKFAFPKGAVPAPDDFVKTVSEVITVQPGDDSGNQGDQASQGDQGSQPAQATAPDAAPAPPSELAPPPPPADAAPPTISIGQTIDEVTAGFGQPQKIVKQGGKVIYYYKDMKVTFKNGKVSDVD